MPLPLLIPAGAVAIAGIGWWTFASDDSGPDDPDTPVHKSAAAIAAAKARANTNIALSDVQDVLSGLFGQSGPGVARVARARSAMDYGTVYSMGSGDDDPSGPTPGSKCDCSRFALWILRWKKTGLPYEVATASICEDVAKAQKLFRPIPAPTVGCFVVYPGHMALITDPDRFTIIDCSHGYDGIAEHGGAYFKKQNGMVFCVPTSDEV